MRRAAYRHGRSRIDSGTAGPVNSATMSLHSSPARCRHSFRLALAAVALTLTPWLPQRASADPAGTMNVPREFHTATLLPDGRVLLAGGNSDSIPGVLRDCETYAAATGTWSETSPLNRKRNLHEQVLLADGRVLAAGGDIGSAIGLNVTGVCEIFDPAANTWTLTHPLATPRADFTANLLPDGNVFAVGGTDDGREALASIEEFDPVAGRWHLLGAILAQPRMNHTATTLPDGSVLVAGGIANEQIVAEAEIFVTPK